MSSTVEDAIKHNFDHDLDSMENDYATNDIQYIYANGWVNFTNLQMVGSSPDKFFDWSQAYVVIPYTIILTTGNCTLAVAAGGAAAAENSMSVACKGNHHLINLALIKYNGVSVNRGSYYVNFYENEKLKMMNDSEYKLYGDMMNLSWDNADSYGFNSAILETNNVIKPTTSFSSGNVPASFVNTGHLNRILKTNFDCSTANSGSNNSTTTATILGNSSVADTLLSNMSGNTTAQVTFQYVATIPLSMIHDFYAKLPTIQNATGFELRLQLNIANSNTWTATYPVLASANANDATSINRPSIITSNQSVGHTCPFLLSQASNNFGTGLSLRVINVGNTYSVTVASAIGWVAAQNGVNSTNPCRIYVPQINYTPSYTKQILANSKFRMLYEDFYADQILNKSGASNVSQLFNAQLARPRTLYLIPFFNSSTATTPANAVSPYLSPLSSAPNTCSICRLSRVQIQIGAQNIFVEQQQYNYQFYVNNLLPLLGKINGNSMKMANRTNNTMNVGKVL